MKKILRNGMEWHVVLFIHTLFSFLSFLFFRFVFCGRELTCSQLRLSIQRRWRLV
ncbi:hypothetical protein DM02DRAFT_157849 [Periconia macrospinosa]|uniref:Uncharacterized protein n=1 Tax=Periconia macrospinosa TaxID=97972 RepID=A0A2V1EE09_9PLEO|nr:hypothetical protein DM02DRAFT_157849 [Periconia macrospinosa]